MGKAGELFIGTFRWPQGSVQRNLVCHDNPIQRESKERAGAKHWRLGETKIGTVKRNMRGKYTAWIIEVIGNIFACASDLRKNGHDVAIEATDTISIIPPGSEELSAAAFENWLANFRKRRGNPPPGGVVSTDPAQTGAEATNQGRVIICPCCHEEFILTD